MKLSDITPQMLAEAMRTYLAAAYPSGEPPQRIREMATVDLDAPLDAALGRECVEQRPMPERPDAVAKYLWRLGNARYPHMKLGIERCSEGDDFVFVVDTHDRDLPADSDVYASPEYQDLIRHNARLKHDVETRLRLAGLPTQAGHIAQYLRDHRALGRSRRKTILIVDDDEGILELEQAMLEEAGYRCLACTCGHDALDRLRDGAPIDLCLLDIMMPLLDGHQTAVQLRRQCSRRFPIVYVTALPRERALDARADDYIGKPFDPDHLLAVIRRYVG